MDNKSFWNDRYSNEPQLGSGPGSRGYAPWIKNYLIKSIIQNNSDIVSLMDAGCGDLCWLNDDVLEQVEYLGIDISDIIIEKNNKMYPELTFMNHNFEVAPLANKADIVICFDVLIHQCEYNGFQKVLKNIIDSSSKYALISYLTPNHASVDKEIPKFIRENAPKEVEQSELEFLRYFEKIDPNLPRAQTAIYGDFMELVREIDDQIQVRPLTRYKEHTIYEVSKVGKWLKLPGVFEG